MFVLYGQTTSNFFSDSRFFEEYLFFIKYKGKIEEKLQEIQNQGNSELTSVVDEKIPCRCVSKMTICLSCMDIQSLVFLPILQFFEEYLYFIKDKGKKGKN